ncbi:MAG TPA: Arc family DNA-binding protein [Actinomycetota bacterium]|nr:Arc family DNA-binding protein [Actinomycetota bacterium]
MGDPKRFLLRVDQRVYDALERWAADDLRSVNSQIEFLLRESLRRAGRLPEPEGPPVRDRRPSS